LKKERKLRIIGLVILLIAFALQIFITIFPAHPSNNSSPNDIISGGFYSQNQAINDCNNNSQGFRDILSNFSITCSSLILAGTTSITNSSYNDQLFSINRIPYGTSSERSLILNQKQFWLRQLSQGDSLPSVKYKALTGISSQGTQYFILYNSGNLAFIGMPNANYSCGQSNSSNCPKLYLTARDLQNSNANGSKVNPGDQIIYTLAVTNPSDKAIDNFVIGTNFSSTLTYSDLTNLYGGTIKNSSVSWPSIKLLPGQTITKNIEFTVKKSTPNTPLGSSDSNYFNMKMTTYYGNYISIRPNWTIDKYFELNINNNFPSQGVLFSLIITVLLIIIVSYFLYRNLLILKELNNVKEDYLSGGKD
jgi:uncharacterized repeat protein (TIGR01451 family)